MKMGLFTAPWPSCPFANGLLIPGRLPAHGHRRPALRHRPRARVAAASVNIVAKNPNDWSKGMVLCITVEFYAILSLLASMLMIINISA